MATALNTHPRSLARSGAIVARIGDDPAYQAFWLLRVGFTVAPILFGLDKFFHVLANWDIYMAPWVADILPGTIHRSMYLVGGVEILAGVVVALKPRYGAFLVAGWLAGIIGNLLLLQDFYDVALRDFGLLLAALTLARLAAAVSARTPAGASVPSGLLSEPLPFPRTPVERSVRLPFAATATDQTREESR